MSHAQHLEKRFRGDMIELIEAANNECSASGYESELGGCVYKFDDGSILVLKISEVYSLKTSPILDEFL